MDSPTFHSQSDRFENLLSSFTDWIDEFGIQVFIVVLFIVLIQILIGTVIKNNMHKLLRRSDRVDDKREETIAKTVVRIVQTVLWIVGVMVVLDTAGYNIAPILTGAGVSGIVIGFGAQSLIKDLISGVFIIAENQYRIGDIVELNGVSGRVEDISLRTTVLRDLDGLQHHILNGSITLSTNKTMTFSRVNIDLSIGYESDIDKVEKLINRLGEKLAKDEKSRVTYIEPIKFLRVKSFADSAVIVKVLGKVKPGDQWRASGEFHREIKKIFDRNAIEIPFPQRVIHTPKKRKRA